jgi:phage-related baseplate assembly protein
MADKVREYPAISFVDTDTQTLVNSLIASYELFTGRTLYPADPARLFILWIADIIIQERIIIDESAKQNVPRYAQGEYLDSLAEIFKDTERLQASAAITTFRFYLSAAQSGAQTVPKGTRVTVDGEITFETTEVASIAPGELYGDAAAVCQTLGEIGNGFAPGQIKQIVDIYPFFERVENVTTSEGGADIESDARFYERLRDSMESFSTAGPVGAYTYWVKTASQKITDVKPTSPEPGVVDIRVLLQNGEFPDAEMIQKIHDTLNGKIPLTDLVNVSEPNTHPFDVDIVYYIPAQREDSTTAIQANAAAAVEAYVKWQTERMGRDINPDELTYRLKAAGVKRVIINAPTFETIADNEVAALQNRNVIYGGVEND